MKRKHIYLIISLLVSLLAIHFYIVQGLEKEIHQTTKRKDALSDSLFYFIHKSKGDSLLISGNFQEATSYYKKADSILGLEGFNQDKVIIAERTRVRERQLKEITEALNKSQMEMLRFKSRKKNEALYKDSVIESSKAELNKMKHELAKLKDTLEHAHKKITTLSASLGKIEIESYNGVKIYYAGDLLNGKANGMGYGLYSTGGIYEGEWKNNLRHGSGKYTWKDGNVYKGEYYGDKRQGKGTYFFASGEKYIGEWLDNKRSGKGAMYDKDGEVLVSGIWENDEIKSNAETRY